MKFIFLSDTHIGACPMGYQQQKGYPEKLPMLIAALDRWIQERNDIEFVLHGGDMVDEASEKNIKRAQQLFRLSVPVYLCLGNHDVNKSESVDLWLSHGSDFFLMGSPNFSIKKDNVYIHVIPNQWEETPYYWSSRQDPHFLVNQFAEMKKLASPDSKGIHFLCTHSPVFGVPMEQTGFGYEYHEPGEAFKQEVLEIISDYPSIKGVLSGHNHINTHVERGNVHFITSSSFSEVPFEVKLVSITDIGFEMETLSFMTLTNFNGAYDYNKTFVQGRMIDRFITER